MSKVRTQKGRSRQTQEAKAPKTDFFDQEEENFEALQMEDHEDREYHELLKSTTPHANTKKNAYFFNNERYRGTKEVEDDAEPEEEKESEEIEEPNQIANALKSFREERKKESKLLTEDVRLIDEEDEKFETMRKKLKTSG